MNLQAIKLNSFLKTLTIVATFVFSFAIASQVWAAPDITAKNITHSTYSTSSDYASEVRAEPGDVLEIQMIDLDFSTPHTSFTATLPADLTYISTNSTNTGATASVSQSGQTITWTFASSNTPLIYFRATVVAGGSLSTNHAPTVNFSNNSGTSAGTPVTVKTGPILKTISPSTGLDSAEPITGITLTGHGFTQTSDITSLTINGQSMTGALSVSGPDGSGYYTISNARIPSGVTVGSYYIVLTTTVSGTALATNADSAESVAFTVTDGTEPVMSSAPSYTHSTGVLTLTFNETIDVSATDLSKITLYDASTGGNSQVLTGATVSTTDSATFTITLTQAQKNTVSAWGVSASNLYIQIAGSGVYDLSNNAAVAQGSRTAITAWTKDTTAPTATISYTQNSASTTSVKAGSVTITATFSEPISATPNIAIDQPGATDIAATAMAGSGTTWTYTYTINAVADGTATVTLTNAPDYANNALGTVTGNTFVLDTLSPSPAISTLSGSAAGQTALTFSWTPTYTASDFSTYKFYYRATAGVTSANGTEVNKNTSGYSSLGTAATNSLNLSGLTAGTTYYAVIYICDSAGNCSAISNEGDAQTNSQAVIFVPTSGGGGGSSAPSAPSTASSAGTITTDGGAITTTTSSGSSATISIPANTASGTVSVSEASATEKQSAPLSASDGAIVGNTVFNIQLSGVSSPTFANPVTLEFIYDPAQLNGLNPSLLNISYFDTALNKWVSLPSTINTTTHKVTAQTTHFTLFAITTVPPASGSTTNTTPADSTTSTPPATTESGQVLGSSVGVYPNGSLLKAPNSPAVFYISNDQKHVITSAAVFNTRFNWNDIVYLPSTRQLDLYEAGDAVPFSVGTLTKEEGKSAVYRISATNGKQPILSSQIFLSRGYKWNQVIEVAPNALASYPEQAYISSADNFYTGDVVKVAPTAKIYQIETGSARLVPNVDVLKANKLDKKPIRSITAKEFKQFTLAADLFYPDGTLVKGSSSSAIYIISDGKKRAFSSGADLDALLYNRKQIKKVADKILAAIETLSPIKLAQNNIHTASAE